MQKSQQPMDSNSERRWDDSILLKEETNASLLCCVSSDCHMFIFGGRSGGKRLRDFWVLDTDIWQWSELTSFGDLPSPRDFAAASPVGNRKIVMRDLSCMVDGMGKSGCQMCMSWTQYHLNGQSYQLLEQCHPLDADILSRWLKRDYLFMVAEVKWRRSFSYRN